MSERKYLVSAVQVFCFVFFHLLSGMMLYGGESAAAALFAALFSACVCVIAGALCEGFSSSREFYASAFGALGAPVRCIAGGLCAYSLLNTLFFFSAEVAVFYGGAARKAVLIACLALAFFAVAKGFSAPARFAELCVFPLALAALISLIGGEGRGLYFGFSYELLFAGFDIIGSVPVLFSLFLRSAGEKSGKMSVYAKNSAFHPSPLACGVSAAAASLLFYVFFRFAEGGNIMFSFFLWFAALSRMTAHTLALCDLLGVPESVGARKKALSALAVAAVFAGAVFAYGLFGEALKTAAVFANVIFPCAAFVFSMLGRRSAEKAEA